MFPAIRLIWQCDRRGVLLKLIYTLFGSLLPLVNLYVLKLMVDGIVDLAGNGLTMSGIVHSSLMGYIFLFCVVTFLVRIISVLSTVNNDVLTQKLTDSINGMIQDQSVRLDMAYYDNPRFHDTFHRAQQEAAFRPIRIIENLVAVCGALLSLVGVAVIMITASWKVLAVMVVAVVPAFCVRLYKSRRIYRFRRETTQAARRANYYGSLLSGALYAKEVRAFGLADTFRMRYIGIRRKLVGKLLAISRRMAVLDTITALVETAAVCVAMLLLVKPVLGGALTVGTFVMLFEAFRRGQGYLGSLVSGISGLYEHKLFISNLFEFLNLKPAIVSPSSPVPFPNRVDEVLFDDITFSYPNTPSPVLSHFSLKAVRGEVTLVVGSNGFGKSTLLKLLLRLYDPQEGAVRINGIDIRNFDIKELRRNMSAIFQDYVQFCFSVRENIAFGDIASPDDENRLSEAIRLAHVEDIIERLPHGVDTMLGRRFEGGEELSMGQWQRIALARQLYSNAPVLFFDEPTAWMDGEANNNFEKTLQKVSKDHVVFFVKHP